MMIQVEENVWLNEEQIISIGFRPRLQEPGMPLVDGEECHVITTGGTISVQGENGVDTLRKWCEMVTLEMPAETKP
jgi:hypothetical protein